ncbi:hypothetical protein N752_28760 [Desulforamulus aquiferis]|nr:hypothetical protein [Desulforamulus aquiferis]RYD01569.1 hypothetical protein N752_28760 [Desulforamulus aquiferis]
MSGKGYEIRHSLPGRLRLLITQNVELDNLGATLKVLPGVTQVGINHVLKTMLICYEPELVDQVAILNTIATQDKVNKSSLYPNPDINKKDLFWSLLAGASLLAAYGFRRSNESRVEEPDKRVNHLEYLAAGITGYTVLSHRDMVNCGNKSLHLDTWPAFSASSPWNDRALMGMFVTWFLNFIEIVFGWPKYNNKCATL